MAGTGQTLSERSDQALRAWDAIRADQDIQFAPVSLPQASTEPGWLAKFLAWLTEALSPAAKALGVSWPVLQWILLGVAALLVAWLLWRLLQPIARIRLQRGGRHGVAAEEGWSPGREEALLLLEDADRLAAEGRYDEAAHLLLRRSVGQIERAQPGSLDPSSTAREIALLPSLPERARDAFGVIAERVERSLFALRRLDAADWHAARDAYADFALADLGTDPGGDLHARHSLRSARA